MNKGRLIGIGCGAAVAFAVLLWIAFVRPAPDSQQVKNALDSALKASKEGRPDGVVEFLANDVEVNGAHYNVNRQFTEFIKRFHPDISVDPVDPSIHGDIATVTSDMKISVLGRTMDLPNVTFTFKKLSDTKWLVFPSHDWKITGATAPLEGYEQLIGQLTIDGSFASGSGLW